MSNDELSYVILLILSILLGPFITFTKQGIYRKLTSSFVGIFLIASWCKYDIFHSIVTTFVNILILKKIKNRYVHWVSFAWCFAYLGFFRVAPWYGLPKPSSLSNAIQLIMTLKLVGLAFEVHESKNLDEDNNEDKSDAKCLTSDLSVFDMFAYSYCYVGIFTGPYYKYTTYVDMIERVHPVKNNLMILLRRLQWLPVYAVCFALSSHYFNVNYVKTDEFYQRPLWYRVFYMTPVFFTFRTRFYCAWLLAEGACITAMLGAYPVECRAKVGSGPSLKQTERYGKPSDARAYDYTTIRNIDVRTVETCASVRHGLRAWNSSVQYWLAVYVHRHLPVKSAAVKMALTFMVSAYWHGIHAGYYLSFLTVPPSMMIYERCSRLPIGKHVWFEWAASFLRMRLFDYMCMGFLLLDCAATLRYWSSVYYCWHAFLAVGIATATAALYSRRRVAPSTKEA